MSAHFCYTMSEGRWLSGKPTGPDSRGRRSRQQSAAFSMAQLDILASDPSQSRESHHDALLLTRQRLHYQASPGTTAGSGS